MAITTDEVLLRDSRTAIFSGLLLMSDFIDHGDVFQNLLNPLLDRLGDRLKSVERVKLNNSLSEHDVAAAAANLRKRR